MITTIHGDMDENTPGLKKVTGTEHHKDADVHFTEYWQLVHRSIIVDLKGQEIGMKQGDICG